uniref:AlNc14C463G11791 protein n=1 Tax=Albugo laibachii Nc14 TaxID=890382 RepID=F0X053_9STRA|nr:AlNc14C463G11791 [Albugo laibachii Nc14]|eukprot:CCA27135.1 AlNc14C463G11791 [Albugo laibachii Nc14]
MYGSNQSGRHIRHRLLTLERLYVERLERVEHLYNALKNEEKRLENWEASLGSCQQISVREKEKDESKDGKKEAFVASTFNNDAESYHPEAFVTSDNAVEIKPSFRPIPAHRIIGDSTIAKTVDSTASKLDLISIGLILCVVPVVAIDYNELLERCAILEQKIRQKKIENNYLVKELCQYNPDDFESDAEEEQLSDTPRTRNQSVALYHEK